MDFVIAGDSIVKHINVDNVGDDTDSSLICCPGARTHRVHKEVRMLTKSVTPSDIIIHVGTNHIPHQTPVQVAQEITDTLKRLQMDLPETNIHFSAVLPKIDPFYNRGINFINNKVLALCKEIGVGFIHHPGFCDKDGHLNQKFYAPSEWRQWKPLHLSHEGVLSLEKDFAKHLSS